MGQKKVQLNFKDGHKTHYLAKNISMYNNRGTALAGKIETVLNDIRELFDAKDLRQLDHTKIEAYIQTLQDRVENGDLSKKTAATYISALNTTIGYANEHAKNISLETISAQENFLSVGHVEYTDKSTSQEAHLSFQNYLKQQYKKTGNINYQALSKSIELQRKLGLRMRESIAIKITEKDLKANNLKLNKHDLPKNSNPREIPIRSDVQRQVLQEAQDFAKSNGWYSLINPNMSLKQGYDFAYNVMVKFKAENPQYADYHFHGERHEFAHQEYSHLWEEKTGTSLECPAARSDDNYADWLSHAQEETGLSETKVKEVDKEVREEIAHELGHGQENDRLDIGYTYLGK